MKSCVIMLLVVPVLLGATSNEQMIQDLDVIQDAFVVKYAPAEWKEKYAGWELATAIDDAKSRVHRSRRPSVKSFQRIVRDFFNTTRDYHTSVHFYSTEMAFLPFQVKDADGHYFVTWIDRNHLPKEASKLALGDEIVSIDGKSVASAVADVEKKEYGNPGSATDHALAQMTLTTRLGTSGNIVPQGSVTIEVKHKGSASIATYAMDWKYFPELIRGQATEKPKQHPFFALKAVTPHYTRFKKAWDLKQGLEALEEGTSIAINDGNHMAIGDPQGFLPDLGAIIWRAPSSSGFKAYTFEAEGGHTVGYIRIPSFISDGDDMMATLSAQAEKFATLVNVFEKETDALVIDQLHNPGGLLFYMYALASMLSDEPLKVPSQRMTITQEDVYSALETLAGLTSGQNQKGCFSLWETPNIAGYPVTQEFQEGVVNYAHFLLSEWAAGRNFTNPYFIYGLESIGPHPSAQYTKPIMLLVDNCDFSCGDFFPAILQDNKRVTLFGSRTAGAGGFVMEDSFPNRHGIQGFHYTGSIAIRLNGQPIENLGVTPDIPYKLTQNDLQNGYVDYVKAVNQALTAFWASPALN